MLACLGALGRVETGNMRTERADGDRDCRQANATAAPTKNLEVCTFQTQHVGGAQETVERSD